MQLLCPLWTLSPIWLQSGGQRESQTECAPCFSPLSPRCPNLSAKPVDL